MSREEIQKLLGGYATGTLSEAERSALYAAALEDQELFDALAKEHALREVLEDPAARREVIAALGPAREHIAAPGRRWLRRPAGWAMAGAVAVLLIAAGLLLRPARQTIRQEVRPVVVADAIGPANRQPAAGDQVAPAPKPARPKAVRRAAPAAAAPSPTTVAVEAAAPTTGAQTVGGLAGSRIVPAAGRPLTEPGHAQAMFAAQLKAAVGYTLLMRKADASYAPAPPGTVFHVGDSVRVRIPPGEAGFVSLFVRGDAAADWKLVSRQRVEKGQDCVLPETGGIASDMPAKLELMVVAGNRPPVRITLEFQ